MNGYQAYKYYMAIKLHFSNAKFNVFENKGHVRGSYEAFQTRNDRMLFERLSSQYNARDLIRYIACNFMYNNPEMIYNQQDALSNYKEFLRRRQSITRVFTDDLDTITNSGALYNTDEFSGSKIPDIIQLYLAGKVTIETLSILNDIEGIIDKIRTSPSMELVLGPELLRIVKSKGFVKYDSYKVMSPYIEFNEHHQEQVN